MVGKRGNVVNNKKKTSKKLDQDEIWRTFGRKEADNSY